MTLLGNALLSKLWESHHHRVRRFLAVVVWARSSRSPGRDAAHDGARELQVEARRSGASWHRRVCRRTHQPRRRSPDRRPRVPLQLGHYDVADAFVALCTAILHAENGCHPVLAPDATWQERRAICGPDHHGERTGVGGRDGHGDEQAAPQQQAGPRVQGSSASSCSANCDPACPTTRSTRSGPAIVVVEARKLGFGGAPGVMASSRGFITRMGRGNATEADRAALAALLEGDDAVQFSGVVSTASCSTRGAARGPASCSGPSRAATARGRRNDKTEPLPSSL